MVKALCDRCKFTVQHSACRVEWTGLFVCRDCFDPRPPYLDPPRISPTEGAPVKNARLDESEYVYADDDNPVTADDL